MVVIPSQQMLSPLALTLISCAILSLSSFLGVLLIPLIMKYPKIYANVSILLTAFAAGTLLGDAVLHLIPEALGAHNHGIEQDIDTGHAGHDHSKHDHTKHALIDKITNSPDLQMVYICWSILVGIYVFVLFDRLHKHHDKHVGYMVLISGAIHNMMDGLAIYLAYSQSYKIGIATFSAIFFHELPHEFADLVVLIDNGFEKWRALIVHFIVQCTAFVGVLLGYLVKIDSFPLLLGLIAGNFIYLSLGILLPLTKGKHIVLEQFGFFAGLVVMTLIVFAE